MSAKKHHWESGGTNADGFTRHFETYSEAEKDLREVFNSYAEEDEFKGAFIDLWIEDETGLPYPVEEDFKSMRVGEECESRITRDEILLNQLGNYLTAVPEAHEIEEEGFSMFIEHHLAENWENHTAEDVLELAEMSASSMADFLLYKGVPVYGLI